MVIDLDACVGCAGCVVACQAENNIPVVGAEQMARHRDMYWLRIDRYFVGDEDDPDVLFEPMLCAQCDHAPCETVCPVAATVQSADGLNQMIYNRCVGTRYCANNCPYKVRRFNWFKFEPTDPIERLVLNPDVVVRSRGVMEKCSFCVQRIQSERIDARRDGRPSFEVQTACQQSCPAQAISFGDSTDAEGPIAELSEKPRAFQVLAELGVKPSLTYMARVRNREDAGEHEASDAPAAAEHGGTP
jgi:molybdopterin-containing oxidoreductase family iron-sulfur binding subunit